MDRYWRYLQLAVGVIGTVLTAFTALAVLRDPFRFFAMPTPVWMLFALGMVSCLTQWITFQRRHFDMAVWLFGATMACWAGGVIAYVTYAMPDCSKDCTVILVTPPRHT